MAKSNQDTLEKMKIILDEYRKQYGNDIWNKYFPKEEIKQSNSFETKSFSENVEFIKKIFFNRTDVFANYWESNGKKGYAFSCKNEWIKNVCNKTMKSTCAKCQHKKFKELSEATILNHLNGFKTIGTYTIDSENKSKFLVFDFDKATWKEEVIALKKIIDQNNFKSYIEISKSGNGAHLWLFFKTKVDASVLRGLGKYFLFESMLENDYFNYDSFDRMFPTQSKITKDGLGNLICVPYAGKFQKNGSYFVDDNFEKLDINLFMKKIVLNDTNINQVMLTKYKTFFTEEDKLTAENTINIVRGAELIFNISELSKSIKKYLRTITSFVNPEFIIKERARMSTYNTPYIINTCTLSGSLLYIPRGLEDKIIKRFKNDGIKYSIKSSYNKTHKIDISDNIVLKPNQDVTFNNLIKKDSGILVAETGFGKSVIGTKLISHLKVKTLILVNTKEIQSLWVNAIKTFCNIDSKDISLTKDGNKSINIRTFQSFLRSEDVSKATKDINLLIIDECHHTGSSSYESIVKKINAKYIYGLSATPKRSDGLTPILTYRIGNIVNAIHDTKEIKKTLVIKPTDFNIVSEDKLELQAYNDALTNDKERSNLISDDILKYANQGKVILVISEWLTHLNNLYDNLYNKNFNVIKLHGNMKTRELEIEKNKIIIPGTKIILATGSYIGEGFDLPDIDTLFITFPFKWSERLKQYIGRMRINEHKSELTIVDYFDKNVSYYYKMFSERLHTYKSLGYDIYNDTNLNQTIYSKENGKTLLQNEILKAKVIASSFDISKILNAKKDKYTYNKIDRQDIKWIIIDNKITWIINSNDIILRLENPYIVKDMKKYII